MLECQSCGHVWINGGHIEDCPECGSCDVERVTCSL